MECYTISRIITKLHVFTALCLSLTAGVLYSLFGRNLDTGEPAAYTDEHWRNVVARLHLTKQQVRGRLCRNSKRIGPSRHPPGLYAC